MSPVPARRFARPVKITLLAILLAAGLGLLAGAVREQSAPEEVRLPAGLLPDLPAPHRIIVERDLPYAGGAATALAYDLYAPYDYRSAAYPLLILIHGGAWTGGDKNDAYLNHHAMLAARLGFVVLSVNYRFAPYPAATDDIAAFTAYVRGHLARFNAGPQTRISIGGFSAGGHLALNEATTPDAAANYACVIDNAGVSDLQATDFPPGLLPFVRNFARTPQLRGQASPVTHIRAIRAASVLLMHAQDDAVVPFSQSILLLLGLRDALPPVTMEAYFPAEGGHGINTPAAFAAFAGYLASQCR